MVRKLIDRVARARNPIKYWRKKGATIGTRCTIYPSVSLGSEPYLVKIGNHVRISVNTQIFTHDGGLWVVRELNEQFADADKFAGVVIGNNVHVGVNCMILPGVTIGNNCIIGAGAVVTKDIPDNSVAVGVPARVIETVDEYISKNADSFDMTKKMSEKEKRDYVIEKYVK